MSDVLGSQPMVPVPSPASPHWRRTRLLRSIAAPVALALGLAVAAATILGRSPAPGTGVAPAAFVVSATKTTLAQRTAGIVVSGDVSAAGHHIPIVGAGQAAFATPQQFSATVDIDPSEPVRTVTEREIVTQGHFYLAVSGGGQDISTLLPGKEWVEVPTPLGAGSSVGTGTTDPLAQLRLLAFRGNTVKSLGTRAISGITTSGYSVTASRHAFISAELEYLATSGLSPTEQYQLAQAARSLGLPSVDVWFDSSRLLRRMTYVLTQTQGRATTTVTLTMDFGHYGVPVSISAPTPGDVASYSAFVAAAQAASAGGASVSS